MTILAFIGIIALAAAAVFSPGTIAFSLLAITAYSHSGILAVTAVVIAALIYWARKDKEKIAAAWDRHKRATDDIGNDQRYV